MLAIQLAALQLPNLRALDDLGVSLAVISSSSGAAVRRMASDSPGNHVPLECFYGDPERCTYALVGARNGLLGVVLGSLNPARVLEYARDALFIGLVGGVMGVTKQQNKAAGADWQQGAVALVSREGVVLMARAHKDPMDLGQPIEDAARALGRPVTPSMHLDYHGATASLKRHFPIAHTVSLWLPLFFLVGIVLIVAIHFL